MADHFNPDDWPNDYLNPNAVASGFAGVKDRLDEIEKRLDDLEGPNWFGLQLWQGVWEIGIIVAAILSWSRNASILYCIGHGIVSWIYVIYFAVTR